MIMKNKYYLDVQTDPAWANDAMARQCDILSNYGCLVTALSNTKVLQNQSYTPKILNNLLREKKGYSGLRYPGLKENQSFVLWDSDKKSSGVCDILGCKAVFNAKVNTDNVNESIKTGKTFYIARIIVTYRNAGGAVVNIGHYINILYALNGVYVCFDTYDGKVNLLEEKDIVTKIRIDYN
jgi:hypothetical protein